MQHATNKHPLQRQTTSPQPRVEEDRSELRDSLRGMDFESGSAALSPDNDVQLKRKPSDSEANTEAEPTDPSGGVLEDTWALLKAAGKQADPAATITMLGWLPGLRANAQEEGDHGPRAVLRRLDRWQRVVTTETLPQAEGLTQKHREVLEAAATAGELGGQSRQLDSEIKHTTDRSTKAKKSTAKKKRLLKTTKKDHKKAERQGSKSAHSFYVAHRAYEDALEQTGIKDLETRADEAWDKAGGLTLKGNLMPTLEKVRGRIFLPEEKNLKAEQGADNNGAGYVDRERLGDRYEKAHDLEQLKEPGGRRVSVGQTAQHDCDFDGAQVKALKGDGKVWSVTLATGAKVVVKQQDGDDRMYADLARASGLTAPETRELQQDEIESLREVGVAGARRGWVVMNFVEGKNMVEKSQPEETPDDGLSFLDQAAGQEVKLKPAQLEVMGRSIAFQLLMKGWDRWQLPVGPGNATHNLENLMITQADGTGTERVALIDNTGDAHTGQARDWQRLIDGYIDEVIGEADGGELIAMAARQLNQAFYKVGPKEKEHLRQGFINFLLHLRSVDLTKVGQQSDRDATIVEFCSEMQTYFLGKVDVMAQQVKGENANKTKLLGYLNRYATETKGHKNQRAQMKARIKKMKRGMGEEEGESFGQWAQGEMDAMAPSSKKAGKTKR